MQKLPWCVEPFIEIAYWPNGNYQMCCIARPELRTTKDIKPIEWWNSKELKRIRTDMANHNLTDEIRNFCEPCLINEKMGLLSRRQEILAKLTTFDGVNIDRVYDNILKHLAGEDYGYEDLLTVNFKVLGNICNLKCFMCGPWSSSKIAADYKKIGKWKGTVNLVPFTEDSKDSYFEEMKKIISNLDKFHFLGGEPLIHPDFPELLSIAESTPNAKNLTLEINTNATVFSDELARKAEKFKDVQVVVSIDGVRERGSYTRNGLNWDEFDRNVKEFSKLKNITLKFLPTISNLTIGYIDELYDYMQLYVDDVPSYVNWNSYVIYPEYHRAINIPSKIKDQYIKKIKLYEDPRWSHKKFDSIKNCLSLEQDSHQQFLKGIEILKYWDDQRNTNLIQHFPEFEEYYATM